MVATGAAKLRRILQTAKDSPDVTEWWALWNLEFRAAPTTGQETTRQQVGLGDATALIRLQSTQTRDWLVVVQEPCR